MYIKMMRNSRACCWSTGAGELHLSHPPSTCICTLLYDAFPAYIQLQVRQGVEPCRLVLTKPACQAWTSVLAWYTGHTVGDQRHPGACLAGRLSQQSWIATPGPASWLWYTGHPVVVSGTSWCHHCRGVWVQGHRLVGYSCPLPPFAANQSTNERHACIAFGCIQLGIISLIINLIF